MRLLKKFFLALLTFSFLSGFSQNNVPEYTIQIGTFVNPKPADFESIRNLGFVYAEKQPDNYFKLFMGGFSSEAAAQKVADQIEAKGFTNPYVTKLNLEGAGTSTVIQLGIRKSDKAFSWESYLQLDELYVILNNNQVKIVTGIFSNVAEARKELPNIKKMGFNDAFVKNVNSALLHEVTDFETAGERRPLIPLVFREDALRESRTRSSSSEIPEPYEDTTEKKGEELTPKGNTKSFEPSFSADLPEINAKVKRNSAYELQKVLNKEGAYKSSLDGYYGRGTKTAYTKVKATNRQLQKYRILAKYAQNSASESSFGELQQGINLLWDDPSKGLQFLEDSKKPIAKAYSAYFIFVNEGIDPQVNQLMNTAIQEAFKDTKPTNMPRFDYNATYAYNDLDQLLLHIRYIHEVTENSPFVPCWLFQKHPGAAMRAFNTSSGSSIKMESCGGFWDWEEIQILSAIAKDLDTRNNFDDKKIAQSKAELNQMFLTPDPVEDKTKKELESWNKNLWKGIDGWAFRDSFLEETSIALKVAFFQSYVLLEDYFMNEGYSKEEAKGMALKTLKALVGYHLDRFV